MFKPIATFEWDHLIALACQSAIGKKWGDLLADFVENRVGWLKGREGRPPSLPGTSLNVWSPTTMVQSCSIPKTKPRNSSGSESTSRISPNPWHHPRNNGQPLFVGIYGGNHHFQGFLGGAKWISQPSTVLSIGGPAIGGKGFGLVLDLKGSEDF